VKEVEAGFGNLLKIVADGANAETFEIIANFSEKYSRLSNELSKLVVERITVNSECQRKLNLYYAVDAIVKSNPSAYANVFAKRLEKQFPRDLAKIKDRRLQKDFLILFLSWEAIFPLDSLKKMLELYFYEKNPQDVEPYF